MRFLRVCVLGLAACATVEAGQSPGVLSGTEPFAVSAVRADGVLIPIARFDGRAWVRMWAEPAPKIERPPTLAEVPAAWLSGLATTPASWFFWLDAERDRAASPFAAREPRRLTATGVVPYAAHCLEAAGLTSDYPDSRPVSATQFPFEVIGLAVTNAAVHVESLTKVEPGSALGASIAEKAAAPFHRAEDDTVGREREALGAVPAFRERRQTSIVWTRIVRLGVSQGPRRTYYLEGKKAYGPQLIVSGHVWLQMIDGRETADAEVDVTDEDGKTSIVREPLGTIGMGERVLWLFRAHGYESETFELVEVAGPGRPPMRILEINGGSC